MRTALESRKIHNDTLTQILRKENIVVFGSDTLASANFGESLSRDLRKKVLLVASIDEGKIITDSAILGTISKIPNKSALMAGVVATINAPIMMLLRTIHARIEQLEGK